MTSTATERGVGDDVRAVRELHDSYRQMSEQLHNVIVGMDDVIEQMLIAILCRGHCILEGVPGLAKTLLVSSLARMLGLTFRRIQFTPDLMPADITGTDVLEEDHATGKRIFRFIPGPLFTNLLLADEVNRTPPKTQSALLEAMQERQVSVGGDTYPLPQPFFVLATQNPIEQEGTYPLPEAQLDRFMLKIRVSYPTEAEEIDIVKRVTTEYEADVERIWSADRIETMQGLVRRVPVPDHVYEYAVRLARLSRPREKGAPAFVEELVHWGAGPRASIYLLLAAKARAVVHGRCHTTSEDVASVAFPVLRHRIIATFNAEAAGCTTEDIIRQLLAAVHPASAGKGWSGDGKSATSRSA